MKFHIRGKTVRPLPVIPCEFRGAYLGEGNSPPIDTLDSLVLIGLQPERVAEYLLYGASPEKLILTY